MAQVALPLPIQQASAEDTQARIRAARVQLGKRLVILGEGTHTVVMEKNRLQLLREVQLFLEE